MKKYKNNINKSFEVEVQGSKIETYFIVFVHIFIIYAFVQWKNVLQFYFFYTFLYFCKFISLFKNALFNYTLPLLKIEIYRNEEK